MPANTSLEAAFGSLGALGSAIQLGIKGEEFSKNFQQYHVTYGDNIVRGIFQRGPLNFYMNGMSTITSDLFGPDIAEQYAEQQGNLNRIMWSRPDYPIEELLTTNDTQHWPSAAGLFLPYYLGVEYNRPNGAANFTNMVDNAEWRMDANGASRPTWDLLGAKSALHFLATSHPGTVDYIEYATSVQNANLTGSNPDLETNYNMFIGNFGMYRGLAMSEKLGDENTVVEHSLKIIETFAGPYVGRRLKTQLRDMVSKGKITKDFIKETAAETIDANLESYLTRPENKPIVPAFVNKLSEAYTRTGDVNRVEGEVREVVNRVLPRLVPDALPPGPAPGGVGGAPGPAPGGAGGPAPDDAPGGAGGPAPDPAPGDAPDPAPDDAPDPAPGGVGDAPDPAPGGVGDAPDPAPDDAVDDVELAPFMFDPDALPPVDPPVDEATLAPGDLPPLAATTRELNDSYARARGVHGD